MVLAGVDEAGYGPLLGPLVVGCCAISVDCSAAGEDWPDVWALLRRVVSRKRTRGKLHINDSKAVYAPAGGLASLETGVLALAATKWGGAPSLDQFLKLCAPDTYDDLPLHPWYAAGDIDSVPSEADPAGVAIATNALRVEMARCRVSLEHFCASTVVERQLNGMLQQTRNKSNVLFSVAARHIDHLLKNFGDRGLTIVCDRQGGRAHYGSLLRLMFEDWHLQIEAETEEISDYRLVRDGHTVRLLFATGAEARCFATAAASMLCKYLRESLMRRFNAFWREHLPQVTPTAGYYTDGLRFLEDIELKRQQLGIAREELVRMR